MEDRPPMNGASIEEIPKDDLEFLDTKAKSARLTESGWAIETDYGVIGSPLTEKRMPRPGINIRFYGITEETAQAGSSVRGIVIGDEVAYYRTAKEQKVAQEEAIAAALEQKKEAYETGGLKERLDEDYASLPPLFQRRIDRFRNNNPDFRWKWETYEMAAVKLAADIWAASESQDDVRTFSEGSMEAKIEFLDAPPNRFAGISQNQFGAAVAIAYHAHGEDPEQAVNLHGVGAVLVGSEEYGCVPAGSGSSEPEPVPSSEGES